MRKSEAAAWSLLALGVTAIVLPLLMALVMGLPWVLVRHRAGNSLGYPDGVSFSQNPDEDYHSVTWDGGDWDKPTACPLVVHLPTGDYDAARLGAVDGLRREGWTETVHKEEAGPETITMRWREAVVWCLYSNRRLVKVMLDAKKAAAEGVGLVGVSIKGKRVNLPASAEAIEQALGPPLPKK